MTSGTNNIRLPLWTDRSSIPKSARERVVARYPDGAKQRAEYVLRGKLTEELHCQSGQPHGIERQWNARGRLRRGYPRYYLRGEQVNERRYERACAGDPSLPKFRQKDNEPKRKFPPEVAKFFKRKKA